MGEKTFLKNKEIAPSAQAELAEAAKDNKPIYDKDLKVFFVNGVKYRRAQNTLDLILGNKKPLKVEDSSRAEHYLKQLTLHEIDPKDPTALAAVYEIMGGLIRTSSEQKDYEKKVEEMRKKGKKKMIE